MEDDEKFSQWNHPADLNKFTIEEIKTIYALYIFMIEYEYVPKMDYIKQYASEHSLEFLQNKISHLKDGKHPIEMIKKILEATNNKIQ